MEKLDRFGRPDLELKIGIYDPTNHARKTLTRGTCCSTPQKLSSLSSSDKLGSCIKETSRLSAVVEPVAAGKGIYFRDFPSNCTFNSDGPNNSDLQNLFNLATVACEVESPLRHRQLLKKRRTPRNFLWINGSRFAKFNDNSSIELPAEAAAAKPSEIEELNYSNYPPWLDKSVQESSAFTKLINKEIHSSSDLKVASPQQSTADKMPCQATQFNWPPEGGTWLSTCSRSELPRPRAKRLPGQDTRVQDFAKRILQFVGERSTAEKFIRGALGNNPDTSKALRLLLRQQKVQRIGDGGRGKPFLYVVTPDGLREVSGYAGQTY